MKPRFRPPAIPRPVRKLLMLILAIVFGLYLFYILDGESPNYVTIPRVSSEKS